jgi:hypothetical protein
MAQTPVAPAAGPAWAGGIVLRYRDIEPDVHIQTDLDDRPGKFYLINGDLE